MTNDLQQAIMRRATAAEVGELARAGGMKSLQDEGIELVLAGQTSTEELNRVLYTFSEDWITNRR